MAQILWLSVYRNGYNNLLASAGDDQTVVCAPLVYLEATVNDSLDNSTTEWVQLTGTPSVTIITVSPTQAYYVAGINPGSDKVFRFYINRNTQIEEYQDVIIRTTPSSVIGNIESGFCVNEIPPPPFTLIPPFELFGDFMFNIVPFTGVIKLLDANDTFASWKLPQLFYQTGNGATDVYKNGFIGTAIQGFNGSSWVDLQLYQLGEQRVYPLSIPMRLRTASLFNIPNKGLIRVYNQWEDLSPEGAGLIKAKDVIAQVEHGVLGNNVNTVKIVYRLDLQDYIEDFYQIEHGVVVNNIVANKIVYLLDIQTHTSDAIQSEHGLISINVTLTRISGGAIGG